MRTAGEKPVILDELYSVLPSIRRIVVKDSPTDSAKVLFESTTRRDVDELRGHLQLEAPTASFHCMCVGSPALYLYGAGDSLVQLTNHHGLSVRCSLWTSDVRITDTEKWLSWFDKRGIPGPRQEVEEMRARRDQGRRDSEKWLASMPKAIRPVWSDALGQFGTVNVDPLRSALEGDMPDERERILALLEWFGSGAGPWSGFPSYEEAAEELLLEYPTRSIVRVILSSSISAAQTEGAARLFGGWSFRSQRSQDVAEIPDALREVLWTHVKDTKDKDKLSRATQAFKR